jgi:hypothetical protein
MQQQELGHPVLKVSFGVQYAKTLNAPDVLAIGSRHVAIRKYRISIAL